MNTNMNSNARKRKRKKDKKESRRLRKLDVEKQKMIRLRSEAAIRESLGRLFKTMTKNVPVVNIQNDVPESTKALIDPKLYRFATGYWRKLVLDYMKACTEKASPSVKRSIGCG